MLGAILGDIVGSPYEFDDNNIKTKDFPLFSISSTFTDDSVLTIAVEQALMEASDNQERFAQSVIRQMRSFGRMYPHAGYGPRFHLWLNDPHPKPYNSWGNGSAMRVSGVAWAFDTLDEVLAFAETSAAVTHNHPEGIKGAQATAAATFLARTGSGKDAIAGYIQDAFGYDLSRSLDEIRPSYRMVASCQETVPQALRAFLEADGFEDAIRNAVSLGGDSDTIACICGAVAEAFWGIPEKLKRAAVVNLDAGLCHAELNWLEWLRRREKTKLEEEKPVKRDPRPWNRTTSTMKSIYRNIPN